MPLKTHYNNMILNGKSPEIKFIVEIDADIIITITIIHFPSAQLKKKHFILIQS